MHRSFVKNFGSIFLIVSILMNALPVPAEAGIIDSIKNAIKSHTDNIRDLDKEIQEYEAKAGVVRKERQTLEGAVAELTASERKLERELNTAIAGVRTAEGRIGALQREIQAKENLIEEHNDAIAEAIRNINQQDDNTLIEVMLTKGSLSEFWSNVDMLSRFQVTVSGKIDDLTSLKSELAGEIEAERQEQEALKALYGEIDGKRLAVEYARSEKGKLLSGARSQEKEYENIIAEKRALKQQFEQSLNDFESKLMIALNPATIPVAQSSTLLYPVDSIIITQEFGYTAFAQGGAYGGKGHNGMDFGVPVGTAVKAARAGVVKGTGDTDQACPNASYGKWVMIEHDNGLSTLYAHLSVISVSGGQNVQGGSVIGYSGNTGYSTGPHLHFTVYASDGAQIQNLPSKGCAGAVYTIPVANPEAYLNPRQYLPR